ncbi:hydrogenase maturation protease [Streptomyces sp. NPDC006879]|uniref:hydrogenase maturation protease n=1 Tax=Streptomyces sp. NPDC006879 TaxID=3364767 RepID=UPI0036CF858D
MSTAGRAAPRAETRTLVAGIGNVFLGDDGFGVEAVRRLRQSPPPRGVEYLDVGIRGLDLAYRLLDGYRRLILVDALARGAEPGTVCVLDAGAEMTALRCPPALDGHGLDPATVLRLVRGLSETIGGTPPQQIFVVGCEPLDVSEGMGLTPPVAKALPAALDAVTGLLGDGQQSTARRRPLDREDGAGAPVIQKGKRG